VSNQLAPSPVPTAQVGPAAPAPERVAWALVTSFALAMVFADGFVVVALRGEAGSVARSNGLFLEWVREALLLLPVYLVAVLAAVTLAQRWHSRGRSGRHSTTVMLGSIMLAGTIAALLWETVSAAYDYRLQRHELVEMPAMKSACIGTCAQKMQNAGLVLQERVVVLAAIAFLIINLVVVLWVYAMRGGVLVPSDRAVNPRRGRLVRSDRRSDLVWVMGASLLGAALIHLAVVPEHLTEWPLAGVFFVFLALAELGAAGVIAVNRSTVVLVCVGLLSAITLALWAYSRTRGLPFGPEAGVPEAIGFADIASVVLELITLVSCLLMFRPERWLRRPAAGPYAIALGLTALLAVTALGFGGSALPGVHAFGVAGHGEGTDEAVVPSTPFPGTLVPQDQLDQGSK
jgi:hypothetical protein